jgi:hypothetical protein
MNRIDSIEKAMEHVKAAEHDVMMDFGEEAVEEGYSDLVESVAADCTPEIAKELRRITIGF